MAKIISLPDGIFNFIGNCIGYEVDGADLRTYGSGMDRQAALKILGLEAGATRSEAKKAYRQLAKNSHPDRYAGRPGAAEAETRMKGLNAAFAFLDKVLPDHVPSGETIAGFKQGPGTEKKSRPRQKSFFASFAQGLRAMAGSGKKRTASGPADEKAGAPPARRTGVQRPGPRPHGKKKPLGSTGSFEDILEKNRSGKGPSAEKARIRPRSPGNDPYSRYVKFKQQQRMQRNRSRRGIVSRVEKITPVTPVSKVGGRE